MNRQEYFNILEALQGQIQVGSQGMMRSERLCTVDVIIVVYGMKKRITLHYIQYVPYLFYYLTPFTRTEEKITHDH